MQCQACGFDNPESMRFCGGCGAALSAACPACGFDNPPRFAFCGRCGARVDPDAPPAHPGQPAATAAPEAERRQITVMFCDLVGSTALAERLDPEDLREVMRAYQNAARTAIELYDGHIAQYLGDGLMTYFGYPHAREDAAQRAISAGLDVVAAVAALDASVPLSVRVGIATGLVVVGETGAGDAAVPKAAVGETPNIAARLQALAEPGTVVIAERTRRLAGDAFDLDDLGTRQLKGVSEPTRLFRVRGESAVDSHFEATHRAELTPLVGRDQELALLQARWSQARDGEGQVVLLSGEAGIGKSRLVQALRESIAEEPHVRLRYQCSAYYANSAFHPLIRQLERAAGFARADPPEVKLDRIEATLAQAGLDVETVAPYFAALLSIPAGGRYPPLLASPQRQKQMIIDALADQVAVLSRRALVLVIFEDAQWADPSTNEVIDQFIDRIQDCAALGLILFRPEFTAPWGGRPHVSALTLNRLGRHQGAAMVERVTGGKPLPDDVLAQILAKTDGVPLFVEELTKTVLASGLLTDEGDRYALDGPLPEPAIPATLQDSLMARLDRLAPVKEVAQIGAVIGRAFPYKVLAAVSPLGDNALEEALAELAGAGLITRRGRPPEASYQFRHALVQDAAYESLLKSKRQRLHAEIAAAIERAAPEVAESEPELLAHHYSQAGDAERAVRYRLKAGRRAAERSATVEAEAHLRAGLAMAERLPEGSASGRVRIDLQLVLGRLYVTTKGYGARECETVFERARILSENLGDERRLHLALSGGWQVQLGRGDLSESLATAQRELALSTGLGDDSLVMWSHVQCLQSLVFLGEYATSLDHADRALALYDAEKYRDHIYQTGHDAHLLTLICEGVALWCRGFADQALEARNRAETLARAFAQPYAVGHALCYGAIPLFLRRDFDRFREKIAESRAIAEEHGFAFHAAIGAICAGRCMVERGEIAAGIELMERSYEALERSRSLLTAPWLKALLAEALGLAHRPGDGLAEIEAAFSQIGAKGERWILPEVHRVKGELLLAEKRGDEAETEFQHALRVARDQDAKGWELRAATGLARLHQRQGRAAEARALLAPVYDWFSEGFDGADLKEARALLDAL